jgi:surface antigen
VIRPNIIARPMVAAVLLLSACSQDGSSIFGGTNQTLGTGFGAVLGGAAGSMFGKGSGKIASAALGATLGALVGNYIGSQLDKRDREQAEAAAHSALTSRSSSSVKWSNPESGNSGTVTARPIYYEHRRPPSTTVASRTPPPAPTPQGGGQASQSTPAQGSLSGDTNSAVVDNPGASPAQVDRSLGTKQNEGTTEVACRTVVSTVKLKDQDAQVTQSKFCRQPDGTWAPAT